VYAKTLARKRLVVGDERPDHATLPSMLDRNGMAMSTQAPGLLFDHDMR
jgi:hypothetical protein